MNDDLENFDNIGPIWAAHLFKLLKDSATSNYFKGRIFDDGDWIYNGYSSSPFYSYLATLMKEEFEKPSSKETIEDIDKFIIIMIDWVEYDNYGLMNGFLEFTDSIRENQHLSLRFARQGLNIGYETFDFGSVDKLKTNYIFGNFAKRYIKKVRDIYNELRFPDTSPDDDPKWLQDILAEK